ncbi:MAG TPA: hypothetical protein VK911_15240 [Vicinamibacterales bacterium]|nr:hypothetical protein [Vicinamibacterales bacterium]
MLMLDNLRVRLQEWRDQSEDPDLVPRFRRLWRAPHDASPSRLTPPARASLLDATSHPVPMRRAS